jgi:zinc protease
MNAARILLLATLVAALAVPSPHAFAAVTVPQPPTPALRLPVPVEHTLPNGLRVVVFTDTRLPIVHSQLLVPAGSAFESDDQAGVASLTVAMLRQGTPSRTPAQLNADLSQLGATFAARCTRDYALVACDARAESFDNALEVMGDVVIDPLFGGDDFAALRLREAVKAAALQASFANLASARLAADLFGPHPYAHDPGTGDPRLLAKIDLATLQAFHRDRWRPDRSVLVIAGDVTADRAFAVATDCFGRWDGKVTPDRVRPAPRPASGVHLVDAPGSGRAEVRVAVAGPGLASPDHDAWALATAAFESIRLPEGARAETQDGRDASMLVLSAGVAPAAAAETARALLAALKACVATPPAGEALATLRRRVVQRYPLTLGTLGAFVTQWQALDFAGAPAGAVADLGTRQARADLGAGMRLLAAPPVVLVLGPADSLRASFVAAGLGTVNVTEITPPEAAAADEAPAPVTPAMLARGKAAVAAAVAAHGGVAALKAVKTLVIEGSITLNTNNGDVAGQFSAVRQDPDRYSFATRFLEMEARQLCSGGLGWSLLKTDTTAVTPLDSLGVQHLQASAVADLIHQLGFASMPGARPVWRGTEMLADRKCDLVEYSTPYGLQRISIDTETHRVLEQASGVGRGGAWIDRRRLADFHRVNGLLLPFVEERTVRGEKMWRMSATAIATNGEVPEALFARPAKR